MAAIGIQRAQQLGRWHVNDYFVYFDLILHHLFRYLHFYPSDCEAQGKAKISRNAYTELTPLDRFSFSLLAFQSQPHVYTAVM